MADDADRQQAIAKVFDAFVTAFATFDGAVLARLFATPGVTLRRDGSLLGFSGQQDVATYYQAALDRYRAAGFSSCRYASLDTHALSPTTIVATAAWDLVHRDGGVISQWRQSYFMTHRAGEWRIFGSAFVAE